MIKITAYCLFICCNFKGKERRNSQAAYFPNTLLCVFIFIDVIHNPIPASVPCSPASPVHCRLSPYCNACQVSDFYL